MIAHVAGLALLLLVSPTRDTDRVVVVKNLSSPVSIKVADYYASKRGVRQVLSVRCANSEASAAAETIAYADFRAAIETPLRNYLAGHPQIDFIVLTKGVPIRIGGAPGLGARDNRPSVDSYLAALDYARRPGETKLAISYGGFTGTAWANRYWNSRDPFTHERFGGYLVTRLDGYTEAAAKALVDRALQAERARSRGPILLDTCPSFGYADPAKQPVPILVPGRTKGKATVNQVKYAAYNADMANAAARLKAHGVPVALDRNDAFVGERKGLMGYISWGSNDRHFDATAYRSLRFAPGAIGDTAVSTSGRTFLPTTGGQSLIADLIAQGITGVKGYTDEPLLRAIASPTILFDRYTSGSTLAESFYAASRFVGWEDVVLGDPLCRPYRK